MFYWNYFRKIVIFYYDFFFENGNIIFYCDFATLLLYFLDFKEVCTKGLANNSTLITTKIFNLEKMSRGASECMKSSGFLGMDE